MVYHALSYLLFPHHPACIRVRVLGQVRRNSSLGVVTSSAAVVLLVLWKYLHTYQILSSMSLLGLSDRLGNQPRPCFGLAAVQTSQHHGARASRLTSGRGHYHGRAPSCLVWSTAASGRHPGGIVVSRGNKGEWSGCTSWPTPERGHYHGHPHGHPFPPSLCVCDTG